MIDIINIEAFVLAAILLNLTPGTDTMYIVSRSASQGLGAGAYSALGISAGIIVHTLLAALGLSVILMQSALLFTIVKIIGALYLGYLGLQMILTKQKATEEQVAVPKQSNRKIFLQGMITNVTNPKVAIFFLAFLPQFVQADTGVTASLSFLTLGLIFTTTGTIWFFITALLASATTTKLRGASRSSQLLNKATGFIFIAMGIQLLYAKS
ncbi:LysE family translocator [Salimicrobium halophilum]|uniref:Threonine/homoserine/homoserine lactone efflux protein n=1 Tax=Salimicrobium halophilum TaxID=86666 RepID=A0A1G8T3P6_9BACI|nr:LysE family translocator [Salimicrobium halophilum]SDJ35605.1 Threonine/homoserine/homoserine lactone efflux protein [Salimicrobium halophilum]